jgi:hypothetical protein
MHPRLYRLLEKHQRIDEQLRLELHRPLPDGLKLVRLKQLKLKIKDVIHRWTLRPSNA